MRSPLIHSFFMHWDGFIVSDKTWMHTPEALAKHYISYNAKVGDTISPKLLSGGKGEWKSDFESPPFWKECPTLKRIAALRSIHFLLRRSLFSVYMKKSRNLLVYKENIWSNFVLGLWSAFASYRFAHVETDVTRPEAATAAALSWGLARKHQVTLKSLSCRSLSDVSLYVFLFPNWQSSYGRVL